MKTHFDVFPAGVLFDDSCYPELIKIIVNNGYLCGSKRFKLDNDNSDWDYVIDHSYVSEYINIKYLVAYNKESELPTLSAKIIIDGEKFKIINVLVTISEQEYDAWVKSTEQFIEMMSNDVFKEIVKDKSIRVVIFEKLRELNGIGNKY